MQRKIFTCIVAIAILSIGIVIGAKIIPLFNLQGNDPYRHVKLLPVPDVRQSTTYSCGAATFQAVISYWGTDYREGTIMEMLGSSETSGTEPDAMVRAAHKLGLRAKIAENLTLQDLENSIQKGVPVIVAIQAWVENITQEFDWVSAWEDGHYVVVIGLDKQHVFVEDPSLLGTKGVIPAKEFMNRWHDYTGNPPLDPNDKKWHHLGIFIEGNKPASQEIFTKVE
jgi:predicted double-glycine peptidase